MDEHVVRFGSHLKDEVLVGNWESVVRGTIRTWNRIAATQRFGELRTLTPPLKRMPYWISDKDWPAPLRAQRDSFLAHLAKPSSFRGEAVRRYEPSTIEQYGHAITILVSAAVAQGVPLASMSSLAEAATPDNLDKTLMFLMERGKGKVTSQMFILALRIRSVAAWCGASAEMLAELDNMCATLKPDRRKRGMTAKNRALLDRLEDQRFHDLVQVLPSLLKDKVDKAIRKGKERQGSIVKKVRRDFLARQAQTAVALELLLTCSLRRENLVSLELGKSLRKIGQPPHDFWTIALEDYEVKNDDALRFTLEPETAALLEWYLAEWRLELCEPTNPWLFPGAKGGRMDPKSLTGAIRRAAERFLGEPITPHQFRHLSAELYLADDPNGLYTVSDHLGHRDPNTTRTYYLRPKQREASRRYQDQIVLKRERAKVRLRTRKARKDGGT